MSGNMNEIEITENLKPMENAFDEAWWLEMKSELNIEPEEISEKSQEAA